MTHPGCRARFLTSLDRFAALPSNTHRSVRGSHSPGNDRGRPGRPGRVGAAGLR